MNKKDKVFNQYKYLVVDLMVDSKGNKKIKQNIDNFYSKLNKINSKLFKNNEGVVYFGDMTYNKTKLFYVDFEINKDTKQIENINIINKTESGILKVYNEGDEIKSKTLLRLPNNVLRIVEGIKGGEIT